MNLLIVNDEYLTVKLLLTKYDWKENGIDNVFCAYSAEDAKAKLADHFIDIILCDIEMPGENGIALIRWISHSGLDCECIFLTCHADFEYAKEAIQLGISDYILLPVEPQTLSQSIQNAIHHLSQRREQEKYLSYGKLWVADKQQDPSQAVSTASPAELVEDCIKYIQQHISSESLTVNQLAQHYYLNPIYLNRLFKKINGTALSQYIIQERLSLAANLLRTTSDNITSISESVGYSSYPNFCVAFKKKYQCSPSQYRSGYSESRS